MLIIEQPLIYEVGVDVAYRVLTSVVVPLAPVELEAEWAPKLAWKQCKVKFKTI
jgi:hypothetical protein